MSGLFPLLLSAAAQAQAGMISNSTSPAPVQVIDVKPLRPSVILAVPPSALRPAVALPVAETPAARSTSST